MRGAGAGALLVGALGALGFGRGGLGAAAAAAAGRAGGGAVPPLPAGRENTASEQACALANGMSATAK